MKSHLVQWSVKRFCVYVGSFTILQLIMAMWRYCHRDHHYARWRRLQMLLAIQYLLFALSLLLWNRLQAIIPSKLSTNIPILASSGVWRGFLFVLLCFAHCCFPFYYVLVSEEPHWLAMTCLITYAFYIQTGALVFAAVMVEQVINRVHAAVPGVLNGLPSVVKDAALSQRLHTLVAMFVAAVMTVIGLYTTQLPPSLKHVDIRLPRLAPALDGVRIALLTDVHIGPSVGRARVQQMVDVVNQAQPDLIAIAGDLVDGELDELQRAAYPLAQLRAELGVYFATGNHEYYHGNIDQWLSYLSQIGVQPLRNTNRRLGRTHACAPEQTDCLCLAGVDDISADHMRVGNHHMNVSAALASCQKGDSVVVVAHQPAAAAEILAQTSRDQVQLIVSGHTHGGQMYVIAPFAWLLNTYFLGLYTHKQSSTQIYVSAGVNYWGPPVKMYKMNEITLIRLTR